MSIFGDININPLTHTELMNRGFISLPGNIYECNRYSDSRLFKLRMKYQAQTHEFSWWVEMLIVAAPSHVDTSRDYFGNNGYTEVDNIVTVQDLDTVVATAHQKATQTLIDNYLLPAGYNYNYFCK